MPQNVSAKSCAVRLSQQIERAHLRRLGSKTPQLLVDGRLVIALGGITTVRSSTRCSMDSTHLAFQSLVGGRQVSADLIGRDPRAATAVVGGVSFVETGGLGAPCFSKTSRL